jgi:hypothetical protein
MFFSTMTTCKLHGCVHVEDRCPKCEQEGLRVVTCGLTDVAQEIDRQLSEGREPHPQSQAVLVFRDATVPPRGRIPVVLTPAQERRLQLDMIETGRWIPPRTGSYTEIEKRVMAHYGAGPKTIGEMYGQTSPKARV